jgi:hypothetical protein
MIRSRKSREKISNERSPRLDCSTTIGTSCIMSRIGDLRSKLHLKERPEWGAC